MRLLCKRARDRPQSADEVLGVLDGLRTGDLGRATRPVSGRRGLVLAGAAAVILAVDALSLSTPGATIMRGTTLAPEFAEIGLECGCSADRVPGRP